MAQTQSKQLGNKHTGTATGTSITLSTAEAVPVGQRLVVLVAGASAAESTISLVGGGLTWVLDGYFHTSGWQMAAFSALAPAGLAKESELKATFGKTNEAMFIYGLSITNSQAANKSGNKAQTGSGKSWESGSVTTVTPNYFILGFGINDAESSVPTASWTELVDVFDAAEVADYTAIYRVVTATGTYTPGGELNKSVGVRFGLVVAYPEEGATTFNDSGSGTITIGNARAESYAHNDSGSGTITLSSGARTESYTHNDSRAGSMSVGGSGIDAASATDARPGAISVKGFGTDATTTSDSGSGTITLGGSGVESKSTADSGSGTVVLGGSGLESYVHNDSGAGSIKIGGSSTESGVENDFGTSSVKISGSGVESAKYSDAHSGSVSFGGEAKESNGHSGSREGTITLEGGAEESLSYGYNDSGSGIIALEGEGQEERLTSYHDESDGELVVSGSGESESHKHFRFYDADPPSSLSLVPHATAVALSSKSSMLGLATRSGNTTLTFPGDTSLGLESTESTLGFEPQDTTLALEPDNSSLTLDNN